MPTTWGCWDLGDHVLCKSINNEFPKEKIKEILIILWYAVLVGGIASCKGEK